MRNGKLIFALALTFGALWAVPADASHKFSVGAPQLPAFTGGDCTTTAGNVVISCSTLAGKPIGTSGSAIPLLSTANTWSASQTVTGQLAINGASSALSLVDRSGAAGFAWYVQSGTLYLYDAVATTNRLAVNSNGVWGFPSEVLLSAGEDHALSSVTASFTYDATVHNVVAGSRGTPLTAAVVATLPQCVTAIKGRTYGLKKADTSANNVTLTAATTNAQTSTADLIDGAATVALTAQYAQVNVQCDGAGNWWRGFY